jgi:hypothetical protein
MLLWIMIVVYSDNLTKHINTNYGQVVALFNAKAGNAYSNSLNERVNVKRGT